MKWVNITAAVDETVEWPLGYSGNGGVCKNGFHVGPFS